MNLTLNNLKIYQLARKLSKKSWLIYQNLSWQYKKIIGDQFIEATDSVGANIAEGYGRYHYLDKIKFYYNSRGSLLESHHWFDLLNERFLIQEEKLKKEYQQIFNLLAPSLNSFINTTSEQKEKLNLNKKIKLPNF